MDLTNKYNLLIKSIFDQSIADLTAIREEPSYKATFSRLSDFLKNILQIIFDLSMYEDHLQRTFEVPRLVQNSVNNLRLALKDTHLSVKQIFNLDGRRFKQVDEGFKSENDVSSSDIPSDDQASKPIFKKQVYYSPPETNVTDLLHLLDQRKSQIEDLKERLSARDQTIKEMTIGYLKDISHLREMYSRKVEHPEEEVFEVSYYDVKQGMDPEIRDYIERQIKQAVSGSKLRVKDLEFRLKALQSEIEQLNRTINLLLAKQDLTQIIKVAFTLEKDKYKFWRVLQDQVGNEFIFDIFEKQKGGYGIDYRQIDDLIQQSQASFRVYQRQREVMEDQVLELVSRAGSYVSTLQKENDMKDQKILSLKDQLEYEIMQAQRDTKLLMEQQFKEREKFLQKQYQMSRMQQLRDWVNVDHQQMIHRNMSRYAILKWSLFSKFLKVVPLFQRYRESKSKELSLTRLDYYEFSEVRDHLMKELKKGQQLKEEVQEDMVQYLQEQVKELQAELNFQQEQICEVTIERDSLKKHNKQLAFRTVQNKHDRMMMQERIVSMQQTIDTMENNFKLYDRTFQAILSTLGFKHDQYVGLKNLSKIVYHSGGPDLQTFVNRLSNLSIDDVGNLRALNNIYLKAQLAYNRIIIKPEYKETSTITNIFDLNHPLTWLENLQNEIKNEIKIKKIDLEPVILQSQSSVDSSVASEEENDRFEKSPPKQILQLKPPPSKRATQHKQSPVSFQRPSIRNESPKRLSIMIKKTAKVLSPLKSEVPQALILSGLSQRIPSPIKNDLASLTQSLTIAQNNGGNAGSSSSDMNQSHNDRMQLSQLSQTSNPKTKRSQRMMSLSVDRQIQTYRSIEDQSTQTYESKKISQEIRLKKIDSRFKGRTHHQSLNKSTASPVPIVENSSRIHRSIQNKFQIQNERLASFIARQNITNLKGLGQQNYIQGSQLVTVLKEKSNGENPSQKKQDSVNYDVDYFKNFYVEHQKSSIHPKDEVDVIRYKPDRQASPNLMPYDTLIPSFIQEIQ